MQERLGRQIGQALEHIAGARGTAVRVEGAPLCTRMRGVRETEAVTRTTCWRGLYREQSRLRAEFLDACRR